ncbi:MAG: FecR domain-containing protein [Bacteroidota bacterium]
MYPELTDEQYSLIIKHLDGSTSQQEDQQLEAWLQANTDNKASFDEVKALWTGAEEASVFEKLDVDADWALMQKNFTLHASLADQNESVSGKIRPLRWVASIAAGIALVLVSYFAYLNLNSTGGIQEIVLSDGTKVWLNEGATLDYPSAFSGAERTVTLTGEAFFDVAKDEAKPFVISTAESRVRVLGTSFNVKIGTNSTEVTVATGKVQLSDADNVNSTVVLTPGMTGIHMGDQVSSNTNENPNFLAWKTGKFTFDGTSITDALDQISNISEKPVRLDAGLQADCPLKAEFEHEPVVSMVETIALMCGLKVKIFNNAYVLVKLEE